MERLTTTTLRIGDWCVNPAAGQISRNGETARVEVRTMRLLLYLAERAGEVVSIDELLGHVWSEVIVAPDSVYQAVTSLRRLLGDDSKNPTYIETVPRLGYRMVATVRPWAEASAGRADVSRAVNGNDAITAASRDGATRGSGVRVTWAAGVAICVVVGAILLIFFARGRIGRSDRSSFSSAGSAPEKSIAVLPFLDLTDAMSEEPFADGMTEELIDKLSKIPELRVPPPTASFYFKGKLWPRSHGTEQVTIAEIAKALGVTYVLDGSVRKAGARVRVDARLIRADNGYVVWSETYDRPADDVVMVQDDIAGEVAKALRASIEGRPGL
jgi:transcriptional activator of cad operon